MEAIVVDVVVDGCVVAARAGRERERRERERERGRFLLLVESSVVVGEREERETLDLSKDNNGATVASSSSGNYCRHGRE